MADKTKPLLFGDTAKFVTDAIGLKGSIVVGAFEDGRIGIATDGLTGQQVQDLLCSGVYLNQAESVRQNDNAVLQ